MYRAIVIASRHTSSFWQEQGVEPALQSDELGNSADRQERSRDEVRDRVR
jgi:hypothetical protein